MAVRIKLREVARAKGIGQSPLSRKANMDLNTIQKFYQKPHTNTTLATLEKLARALEVEIGELIELDPLLERKEKKTEQREENEVE